MEDSGILNWLVVAFLVFVQGLTMHPLLEAWRKIPTLNQPET
ncbi:hypothetical protein [Microcoleus sp. herbarium5]